MLREILMISYQKRPGRPGNLLNNGFTISIVSLVLVAGLVLLLWQPWNRVSDSGKVIRFKCAAGMKRPVDEIIQIYKEKYGVEIRVEYGGSGTMLSQVKLSGGDLYLSADIHHMKIAVQEDLVGQRIPVAQIQPVLILNPEHQKELTQEHQPVKSISDILRDEFKIVLGAKKTAVGQTSRKLLQEAGLWEEVEKRQPRYFPTVNHICSNVAVRKNVMGIVWDANAVQFNREKEKLAVVPIEGAESHRETIQIGLLKSSDQPAVAMRFARFLTAPDQGQKIFAKHHFKLPESKSDGKILTKSKDPSPIQAGKWKQVPRLTIFAGTMLKDGLDPIIRQFEEEEGVKITVTYNGCGALVATMNAMGFDSPKFPDAYVSCDEKFATKISKALKDTQKILQNELVFTVPKGNPKNVKGNLNELERADLRIGLCDKEKSAMGKIFNDVLISQNIQPKDVTYFPSGHMLINHVRTGTIDVGVAGITNARSSESHREKLDTIPFAGPILTQTFSISKKGFDRHPQIIRRLFQKVLEPENIKRFQDLGFKTDPLQALEP